MTFLIFQLLIGTFFALLVALVAFRLDSLTKSGAIAATVIGSLIFGFGGIEGAVLLMTFFITGSALSKLFKQRKQSLETVFEKGSQRDWGQVVANGGVATVVLILASQLPEFSVFWFGYAGALAAVTADTWATELGTLSKQQPRFITNFKPVPRGTSGGITFAGLLSSLFGAMLIGVLAVLFQPNSHSITTLWIISFAGLAGSLFDSLLGATLQSIYYDAERDKETEHKTNSTESPNQLIRGIAWLKNDLVNALASLFSAVLVILIYSSIF